jgi:PAS domain S-box-containing protein
MKESICANPEVMHESDGSASRAWSHGVHFYEDDQALVDRLGDLAEEALGSRGSCLIVTTQNHAASLLRRLADSSVDLHSAIQASRFILLDAQETIVKFMVEGWPDEALFRSAIEPCLQRAESSLAEHAPPVLVFGEMVSLLWNEGKTEAAIRLEQLWNTLARRHPFSLRCAYPIRCFGQDAGGELFHRVCAEHSEIVPGESYTSIANEQERLEFISSLQQKAQSLQAMHEAREQAIAERKQAEERLQRTEEFARQIVENSIDCVKVLDLDGRLEFMSPPGQRALGIEDVEEILGKRWVDFWPAEDQPRAQAALDSALQGNVGSFRGDSATSAGVLRSWDVKISPVRGCDGKVERLIAISRDITELKWAQKAILDAEKLAAAGRLAATIAHEINNPLEAVTNYIYLARTSKNLSEEVSGHLEIADQELARVAQIAQQTLGFYRDNGRHTWIGVAELVRQVFAVFERKLHYNKVEDRGARGQRINLLWKSG